jgi:cell division protein FtsN
MAAPRRVRSASKRRMPGWVILLLGLTLGIAAVLIIQLVTNRSGSHDGLAGLFRASPRPPAAPESTTRNERAPVRPKLDFYTVLPEVETVLPDRSSGKTARTQRAEEGTSFVLQAGSFASYEDADQLKAKLALQGLQGQIQKVSIEGKGDFHRVRLGPYDNLKELDNASQQLAKMGIKPMRLKVKKGAG